VAIFGLFGKKDGQPATPPADKNSSRTKREEGTARVVPAGNSNERSKQVQRNAARATATAKKIDAIESEMSSEFNPGQAANSTLPGPEPVALQRPGAPAADKSKTAKGQPQIPASFEATLPIMGMTTEFLLGEEGKTVSIEVAGSEVAQVIEEAAILFANDQTEMVEQMLQSAILDEALNGSTRTAWWMLFDLYQITGKQQQFDGLSIEYASKFETSPPAWVQPNQLESQPAPVARTGATPTVPFSGKLDSNIIKLLERAQKLGENTRVLRLEFSRVTEVDPIGCGLLLRILKKLQNSEHDLILVGAPGLAAKIRSILQVGRRDETEAPWLLLLEILRLLNSEKEFEEASIDYCITFEVSPPAFVAPKNKVTTAADEGGSVDAVSDSFTMPALIEGRTDQLISAITSFAADHNPAVLDCSRLNRVDFSAAGQLLSSLAPLSGNGKTIELHNVNHLVTALFNVMGLKDIARILPRKH
jgi:ABC-type transporter Mla MlaB component